MKKAFLSLFFLCAFTLMNAQNKKTCDTPQEAVIEELNSITKCTIKSSKKSSKRTRQISVRVSAPKKRFLKKRVALKRETVTGANNLNSSGVAETKKDSELSKSLKLKNSIVSISNTLSAEEVRKADKFSTVNKIPTFKKCENTEGDDRLDCFNTEMIKHIEKHFNYPNGAVIKKIQGEVWVRFIIDANGDVTNIKTLGPEGAEILNEEAKRVVAQLPKFIPGIKNGKNTSVKYGFPINFSLE